jgi:hypothetical protein
MNCGAYKTVAVWEDPVTLLKWEDVPTTTTVYNWSVNTSYEAPTWS